MLNVMLNIIALHTFCSLRCKLKLCIYAFIRVFITIMSNYVIYNSNKYTINVSQQDSRTCIRVNIEDSTFCGTHLNFKQVNGYIKNVPKMQTK